MGGRYIRYFKMGRRVTLNKQHAIALWRKFIRSSKVRKRSYVFPFGKYFALEHKDHKLSMELTFQLRDGYTVRLKQPYYKYEFELTMIEGTRLVELWEERPDEIELSMKQIEDLL